MLFNATHTNLMHTAGSHPISGRPNQIGSDSANNLGYGIGTILRRAFDSLSESWQSMWAVKPSSEQLIKNKTAMIYRQGLQECVKRLDAAFENLRKNPNDASALKRLVSLAADFAPYLKPTQEADLRPFQQKLFKPLEEKVAKIAHPHLKNSLRQIVPIFFPEAALKRALQVTSFPAVFNLATLDGTNGFQLNANGVGLGVGGISSGGDVNGDGRDDLAVGAFGTSSRAGRAYIVFGRPDKWPAQLNLDLLNGTDGFAVNGLAPGDQLGVTVNIAGDLNYDGFNDFAIGAYGASPGNITNAGSAYVIFGKQTGWTAQFNLANLNGANGFSVNGLAGGDSLGFPLHMEGDINGDGKRDLLIGASYASSRVGSTYVLFGQTSGWSAKFNLANLNGINGLAIPGVIVESKTCYSSSSAGDLNGDDIDDLAIGAPDAGKAYIVFGQRSGWPALFNLAALNGTNGFLVNGLSTGGLGHSISTAGDLNGDGKKDLVIGTWQGTIYVLFQPSNWPSQFDLSTLNGTNGFLVNSFAGGNGLSSGVYVTSAGDLNGDSKVDLVIGVPIADPSGRTDAGTTYVLFQPSNWPAQFNLSTLDGSNGFVINGLAAGDQLGRFISTSGDLNGDGISEMFLGAPGGTTGTAYVIFGKNTSLSTSAPAPSSPLTQPPSSIPAPVQAPLPAPTSTSVSPSIVPSSITPSTKNPAQSPMFSIPTSLLTQPSSSILAPVQTPIPAPTSTYGSPLIVPSSITPSTKTPAQSPTFAIPTSPLTQPPSQSPTSPQSIASPNIPTSPDSTIIGIGAGVGGIVLLGGLAGIIVVLKRKKKGCFAEDEKSIGSEMMAKNEVINIPKGNDAVAYQTELPLAELPDSRAPTYITETYNPTLNPQKSSNSDTSTYMDNSQTMFGV